jgi:periplasmic protein CpxP/Spy
MNFNFKTLALGSVSALLLVATPLVATQFARAGEGGLGHHLEQLDLTDAQSTQIEAIRTEARTQKEAILTPEQRATLEAAEADSRDGNRRGGWRDLNLTDEQRSQTQAIREASKERIDAVLTAEQRQQLESSTKDRAGRRNPRGGDRGGHFEQLDLSEDQSTQIETIRSNTRSQIEEVLTPEQRAEFEENGDRRGALRNANLTDDQRSQIETIQEDSKAEIDAVLTPEQRQQLEQMHQGRNGDRPAARPR